MMCTGFDGYGCADAAGRGGCATAVAIASNTDPMVPRRYRCPRGLLVEGILRRSRMDIARGVRHRQFKCPLSGAVSTGQCNTLCLSNQRSVADEAETADPLHREPEGADVGALAEG